MTDFAAILVLLVLSIAMAGYILSHERLRFPFIQSSPTVMNAEFSTAQAVTPGQGQTVRVSGVEVGQIGKVSLQQRHRHRADGHRRQVQAPDPHRRDRAAATPHRAQGHVHRAQSGLTPTPRRPSPASPSRSPTRCLTSTSTRSWPRWIPTRAPTWTCWSTAPARDSRDRAATSSPRCSQRFEPTHRDLARLNQAVAVRGTNLTRLVNSLQRLNTALAAKQTQIVSAGRLQLEGVPRVRLPGSEPQPRDRRSARDARPDDRHADQGPDVRQPARPGGDQPAARRPRAPRRQPGARPRWRSRARRSSRTRSGPSSWPRARWCASSSPPR